MPNDFYSALLNMPGWEGFLGASKPKATSGVDSILGGAGGSGDWLGWLMSQRSGGGGMSALMDERNYPSMVRGRQAEAQEQWEKAVDIAAKARTERTVKPAVATPVAPPTPPDTVVTPDDASGGVSTITLDDIAEVGRQLGLDDDAIRVAQAIADTEGGMTGAVGDANNSYGPYQFHRKGMLPSYAESLQLSVDDAAEFARQNPIDAVDWALRGYLGQMIIQGAKYGLRGEKLAEYVQRNGQRSQQPERARDAYRKLFGGG